MNMQMHYNFYLMQMYKSIKIIMQEKIFLLNAHGIVVSDKEYAQNNTSPNVATLPPNVIVISLCYKCMAHFNNDDALAGISEFLASDKATSINFAIDAVDVIMKTGALEGRYHDSLAMLKRSHLIHGTPDETRLLIPLNQQPPQPTDVIFNVNEEEYKTSDNEYQFPGPAEKKQKFITSKRGHADYCIYYGESATALSNAFLIGKTDSDADEPSDWTMTLITQSTVKTTPNEPILFNRLLQKIGNENSDSINIVIAPICFSNKPVNSRDISTRKPASAYGKAFFTWLIENMRRQLVPQTHTGRGYLLEKYNNNKQLYTALAQLD